MDRHEVIRARGLAPTASKDLLEAWQGIDGVEQDDSISTRAIAALRQNGVLSYNAERNYLIATHAGVIEAVLTQLLPIASTDTRWIKVPPASSIGIAIEQSGARLLHLWPNPAALE